MRWVPLLQQGGWTEAGPMSHLPAVCPAWPLVPCPDAQSDAHARHGALSGCALHVWPPMTPVVHRQSVIMQFTLLAPGVPWLSLHKTPLHKTPTTP